jgi:predicted HTH transcriptional regulator
MIANLETRADAIQWIYDNQAQRRNLTLEQMGEIRGLWHEAKKKEPHRPKKTEEKSVKVTDLIKKTTAEKGAEKFGVSPSTIEKDAAYARSKGKVAETVTRKKLQEKIDDKTLSKTDVTEIAKAPDIKKVFEDKVKMYE